MTKGSYALLIACIIAHFMNHLYTGALSPFLPIIQNELALSLTEVGFVSSASIVTMTMSHLLVGYLGDKGWRDIFIPASVFIAAIVVLLTSFATTFVFLTITQLMLGFAQSGYHPSAFPAITEKFPTRERAKAVGATAAGGLAGMAVIPILGVSLLVILGDWRSSLLFLAIIGLITFVPTFGLMRYNKSNQRHEEIEEDPEEETGPEGWTRDFALVAILKSLRGIPFRSVTLLMPLYLVVSYGYEPVWAGALTTDMLGAGLVGEIVSAPISDRMGKRVPFMVLSVGVMAPGLLLLNYALEPVWLVIVLIGIGFFYFLGVPPGQAYETEVAPKNAKGLAFGLLFSVAAIPGALSPFFFGLIGDTYGLSASIMFLAIVSVLATILTLFMREPSKIVTPTSRLALYEIE
ncbi:MAG: MFS transporter [Candidatus Thorarchaeota archaeon]